MTKANLGQAYEWHYLDIGYGVSITGPHTVARMTNSIDVQIGDKVLEIGTGSGYQSAYLANLTNRVYTIEIIKPLFDRTGGVYGDLHAARLQRIQRDQPHAGRRLLRLGRPGAVRQDHRHLRHRPHSAAAPPAAEAERHDGDPGRAAGRAARARRSTKQQAADGSFTVARSDIYDGGTLSFVPFTKLDGAVISGTHNGG